MLLGRRAESIAGGRAGPCAPGGRENIGGTILCAGKRERAGPTDDPNRNSRMPIDAQTQIILKAMSAVGDLTGLEPKLLRQMEKNGTPPLGPERENVESVREVSIPDAAGGLMAIRIYTPREAERIQAPTPVLVYLHGGGHVLGSLNLVDGLCCQLARGSGWIVVSVDYRLAPEHKFPAAAEDAYAAAAWVHAHAAGFGGDPARIAVAGDSAGANLAAVACLMAKDRGGPAINCQVLLYPSTNGRQETASSLRNGEGYLLSRKMMDWFSNHYLRSPEDRGHPYLAPLVYHDHSGLPPALVVTAEYDPLLDEGKAYAIHGFVGFYRHLDQGREAIGLVCEHLRKAVR
jgi:acetyl esterase